MRTATRTQTSAKTRVAAAAFALLVTGGIAAAALPAVERLYPGGKECGAYGQSVCEPCKESLVVNNDRRCACPDGTIVEGGRCEMPVNIKASSATDEVLKGETWQGEKYPKATLSIANVILPRGADYLTNVQFKEIGGNYLSDTMGVYQFQIQDIATKREWNSPAVSKSAEYTVDFSSEGRAEYLFKGLPTDTPLVILLKANRFAVEKLPIKGRLQLSVMAATNGDKKFNLEAPVNLQEYSVTTQDRLTCGNIGQKACFKYTSTPPTGMTLFGCTDPLFSDTQTELCKKDCALGQKPDGMACYGKALADCGDVDQKSCGKSDAPRPGMTLYGCKEPLFETQGLCKKECAPGQTADNKACFDVPFSDCGDVDQKSCGTFNTPTSIMTRYGCKEPLFLNTQTRLCKKECALGQSPDGKACYGVEYSDCGTIDKKACWESGKNQPPFGMTRYGCKQPLLETDGYCKKECAPGQRPDGDKCYGKIAQCGTEKQKACALGTPNTYYGCVAPFARNNDGGCSACGMGMYYSGGGSCSICGGEGDVACKEGTPDTYSGCRMPFVFHGADGRCLSCPKGTKAEKGVCAEQSKISFNVSAMMTGWIANPPPYRRGDAYKQVGVMDVRTSSPAKLESIRIKGSLGDKYGLGQVFSSLIVARATASPSLVPSRSMVDGGYLLTFAKPYSFDASNPDGGNWGAFYFMGSIAKDAVTVSTRLEVTDLVFNVDGQQVNHHLPSPIGLHTITVRR